MNVRTVTSRPGYVMDENSLGRTTGNHINWEAVPDEYKNEQGKKVIAGGSFMSEVDGSIVPMDGAGATTAKYILISTEVEGDMLRGHSGVGCFVGGAFYENQMPEFEKAGFEAAKAAFKESGWAHFGSYTNDMK